ncbi:hypothetical protein [Paraferrimonas sedimenticola]|uniref:Uncharacterized protein n=1 Tax=Paraferrimonas sedimenticola TaxID=375674 RepID=A0AA37W2A7_9GAMM|nr:hypothetical protein [Paraferrimonas sedimenticola]GLP97870.1 hypothetical protein GCM10007895_31770 [Paraferrimonas sedimenticola]
MKYIMLLIASLLPSLAVAHEGHDHGHWSSGLIHLITLAAVVAVVAVAVFLIKRNKAKTCEQS